LLLLAEVCSALVGSHGVAWPYTGTSLVYWIGLLTPLAPVPAALSVDLYTYAAAFGSWDASLVVAARGLLLAGSRCMARISRIPGSPVNPIR
jgi:hypothetical protein